jgi:hypothetical protein
MNNGQSGGARNDMPESELWNNSGEFSAQFIGHGRQLLMWPLLITADNESASNNDQMQGKEMFKDLPSCPNHQSV